MGQALDGSITGNPNQNGSLPIVATLAGPAKVLIVDDEPDIVEEVVEQLEDEGLVCLSAFNAKSAMELVGNDPEIGVIVTDIRMPGMDGLEMSRRLKASAIPGRDLFIIVVTGHAGMKEAVEALQLGAEDFLTKPISSDHLLHSVRRAEEMIQLRQHERNFQEQLKLEVQAKTADLNEANVKLSAANQIKDQFLSMMGHELRTPLNAINGFTEMLKDRLSNQDATTLEYLTHIMDSGKRLEATIENILEFSEATSGARKAHLEWQSLDDILTNVMGNLARAAQSKGITLQSAPLPHDQLIEADGSMLIKALMCVVDNAIKFSPTGTTVTLGAERSADAITVFVQDQGCGMDEAAIALALQPMRQVDSTLSRPTEGTGIGLSLAMMLTQLQDGRLEVSSTPGEGTLVRMIIQAKQVDNP